MPIFILIVSIATKASTALSQATIFGGSIVNMAFNFKKKHPLRPHRTLTDIGTILVFEPMLLGMLFVFFCLCVVFQYL